MSSGLDPVFVLSNHIEAIFWSAIGLLFLFSAFGVKGAPRHDALLAAVVFIAFGGSDAVEARTGAWWRPWWLLAWKAACLAFLLALLIRYIRRRRAA